MKLENQVCTLEQAKRLKGLGVEGDCLFHYMQNGALRSIVTDPRNESGSAIVVEANWEFPAFTVAELGVLLPCFNKQNGKGFWLAYPSLSDEINEWVGVVETPSEDHSETIRTICKGDTEAQARAAMLIYLLENNLTTAEEVNQRLQNA